MVEPYFNAWLEIDKAERGIAPTLSKFNEVWRSMNLPERLMIALFLFSDFALIAFSIIVQFDHSLLYLFGFGILLFLVLTLLTFRTSVSFHRRLPGYSVKHAADFSQSLRDVYQEIGLVSYGQIELVRNEAAEMLDRKERSRAAIIRYTFDAVVLVILAATVNHLVGLLEHGMSLEEVVAFLIFEIVMAAIIILLVYGLWLAYDRLGALPTPKLRSFIEDLTSLMIYQIGVDSSCQNIRSRAVMKRVSKKLA